MKSRLNDTKHIHVRPDSLFTDFLNAYRDDTTLEQHNLSVCLQAHSLHDNACSEHDTHIETGTVFVTFWEEAFRKHFTGNNHMVPVLDPSSANDFFKICGRILVHGLVLENYFPVRLSPACLAMSVTEGCSVHLLLTSFYQVMYEAEKDVLEVAMAELRSGAEHFSGKIERCVKIVLGSYGFKNIPAPFELDAAMTGIARMFILYQPHWSLCQLRAGMIDAGLDIAEICEEDVLQLYQILAPTVSTLLQRVHYTSPCESTLITNVDKVKSFFEEYLHKMSKPSLLKLLQQWCGYDCLCIPKLTVRFADDDSDSVFSPKECTLRLPLVCTSFQEMTQVFEAINSESKNSWEYTL